MYPAMILALFLVLPVGSILVEALIRRRSAPVDLLAIAGRWFVFWPVGVRLFTAGLMQVFNPAYTAEDIFGLSDPALLPLVSELGFANVTMGTVALVSAVVVSWRTPAALIGLLYFGLAGTRHLIDGAAFTDVRLIAMISDLFIAVVLGIYLVTLLARRGTLGRLAPSEGGLR